jgi:hypothetical protein
MAYKSKDGTVYNSEFDNHWMPSILQFAEIGEPDKVQWLRDKLRAAKFVPDNNQYARLRLKGTYDELGVLKQQAQLAHACVEFTTLIEDCRVVVAKAHDAAPAYGDRPVKLVPQVIEVAPWAKVQFRESDSFPAPIPPQYKDLLE